MIDLSYLSEEEQEMIMAVLKRDSELKKSEEERIKQLQKEIPEEDRRRYMSGEWFYEMKSQRHRDTIHGSDIIMASMNQWKPTDDDCSWGERSRSFNIQNSDGISDGSKQSGTLEAHQESLNIGMRSPSKPRHNPFNSIPVELDFEETGGPFTNGASESRLRTSYRGFESQVKHQEPSHTEDNTAVSNTMQNNTPRQKPVPKKRTKIFKPQSSFSDSASSVSTHSVSSQSVSTQSISTQSTSTQSVSTLSVSTTEGSGIRSPAPRNILKYSSSCSSNESTLKNHLPQPVVALSYVRLNSHEEKGSEERRDILERNQEEQGEPSSKTQNKKPPKYSSPLKLPKSRLPVRAPSQLINPLQSTQEEIKIQPCLSLSSIPVEDDDKQLEGGLKQNRTTNNCPLQSPSMKPESRNISNEIMGTYANTKTALTTNTEKPLGGISAPQHTKQRSETVENHMTIVPKVEMTRTEEHLWTAVDQQFPSALNTEDTFQKGNALSNADCETENSPSFNIKTNNSNQESKPTVVTDSHIPNPTGEQGDSITKVLEWFSKSLDSSDKLDVESNQDMEEDIKIDDIDFEDEASETIKTRDNIYLIIPRQSEDKSLEVNSIFLEETDWGKEQSVDEPPQKVPKPRRRSESNSHKESLIMKPSTDFALTQSEDNVFMEVHKNEKKDSYIRRDMKQELEKTDFKVSQLKETLGTEDNQRPKLANLRSFWERENNGPKILISRSNAPAKSDPLITNDVNIKPAEGVNDQSKAEQNLRVRSPEHQNREPVSAVEISDFKYVESTNTVHKPQIPIVTGESKESLLIYSNQKKDQILPSSHFDEEVTCLPCLKSSLDSGSLSAGQNVEIVGGNVSISSSDRDCTSPKELETKSQTAPRPYPVPLVKQHSQPQENMAEKLKQLKSFWEKEKLGPRTSVQNSKSSTASTSKLNKRFTKSEFDLRSIGTEFDDDDNENNTSDRGANSPNFSMYVLQKEKPFVKDGISTSQFKNLRDFWGGSPMKQSGLTSPVLESGIQSSLGLPTKYSKIIDASKETHLHSFKDATSHASTKMYNIQSERNNVKALVNENHTNNKISLFSSPAKTERAIQSPLKKRITTRQESGSKNNQSHVDPCETISHGVSHITQTSVKDPTPPKHAIGQESQPQQHRSTSKGSLNAKANAMRRASSMFSVNTAVEGQTQGLHLQSKKSQGPNLPQVKKVTDSNHTPSRKTLESSYTLPKTENSLQDKERNPRRKPSRTSKDSESQPLARSFIPPDYQHYLGITENRGMYTPPPLTEQMEDFLCTSFTFSPETSHRCKCSPVSTSTPVAGSPDLQTRRRSLGLPSTTHFDGHACHEAYRTSAAETRSHPRGTSNRDNESSVQKALRRAKSRPVYHKSMDNISTPPEQGQNNKETDNFVPDSHTYVQTSFATSDPGHLKHLSKSVPSFLQKESDGGESDSESSSHSGVPQRNNRPYTNLSSYSGSASLSSVTGSVASVYSSDYSSVEVQGTIQFSLYYVQKLREFHVFVVECQNLAAVDVKRNRSDPYVKCYLIPDAANLGKRKTSVKKKTLNPTYSEILRYRVQMEYLKSQVLNLSVWHNDTFGRNSFLGEAELELSSWNINDTGRKILPLKPRNLSSQSSTSLQSSDLRGQMRLAIRFLPQISQSKSIPGTGEVHIWVKDCKNLPLIRGPSIDPYVKCFVLPDTSRKSRQKTRVLKKTTSPIFNHTMVYDGFRAEDLKEACVELTVWDHDHLANHLLGGLRLGMGTGKSYGVQVSWMDSTAEEVDLWRRMMEFPSEWIEGLLPLRMITTDKNTWK